MRSVGRGLSLPRRCHGAVQHQCGCRSLRRRESEVSLKCIQTSVNTGDVTSNVVHTGRSGRCQSSGGIHLRKKEKLRRRLERSSRERWSSENHNEKPATRSCCNRTQRGRERSEAEITRSSGKAFSASPNGHLVKYMTDRLEMGDTNNRR